MWRIFFSCCLHLSTYSTSGVIRECKSKVAYRGWSFEAFSTRAQTDVQSHLKCAVDCMADNHCTGYVYSPLSHECLHADMCFSAYKKKITVARKDLMAVVVQLCKAKCYKESSRKHKKAGSHLSKCKLHQDCKVPGEKCISNYCKCPAGHYWNPRNNTCVTRCDVYSSSMTHYHGLQIKGNNDKIIFGLTKRQCQKRCLELAKFVCLTAEWGEDRILGKICRMSIYGYLDVPEVDRLRDVKGFSLSQRSRCK